MLNDPLLRLHRCPLCSSRLVVEDITELVCGVTPLSFRAAVCLGCSEKFYTHETIKKMEKAKSEIANKLDKTFKQ